MFAKRFRREISYGLFLWSERLRGLGMPVIGTPHFAVVRLNALGGTPQGCWRTSATTAERGSGNGDRPILGHSGAESATGPEEPGYPPARAAAPASGPRKVYRNKNEFPACQRRRHRIESQCPKRFGPGRKNPVANGQALTGKTPPPGRKVGEAVAHVQVSPTGAAKGPRARFATSS
jgi:hypothetical protein